MAALLVVLVLAIAAAPVRAFQPFPNAGASGRGRCLECRAPHTLNRDRLSNLNARRRSRTDDAEEEREAPAAGGACSAQPTSRRDVLRGSLSVAGAAVVAVVTDVVQAPIANAVTAKAEGKVQTKVFIEIRVMEPLNEANGYSSSGALRGRVVIGLFDDQAPKTVANFLKYINLDYSDAAPSYAGGLFSRLTPGRLLEGGRIKGLNLVNIAGNNQLEFGGQIYPAVPSVDRDNGIAHDQRGLLSRRKLDVGPEFAITLAAVPELDNGEHTVFGKVLEGQDVLERVESVPVMDDSSTQDDGSFASNLYKAQRKAALSVGKNVLGDERAVDRTGTPLRRIDISGCGLIK